MYWPGNETVSVECNVYFAAAEWLEGEAMDVPTSKTLNFEVHTVPLPAPPPAAPPPAPAFLHVILGGC